MLQAVKAEPETKTEPASAPPARKTWRQKQAELKQGIVPVAYGFDEAVVAGRTNRKRLRRALNAGELPGFKDGKKLLILASDLIAWRQRQLVASPYRPGVTPIREGSAAE